MLSQSDILKLRKWVVDVNGKIIFLFKNSKYRLVIDKFIHAEDNEGKTIEWSKAFGPQLPHQVVNALKIEKIIVKRENKIFELKSVKDLVRMTIK